MHWQDGDVQQSSGRVCFGGAPVSVYSGEMAWKASETAKRSGKTLPLLPMRFPIQISGKHTTVDTQASL
jgi:hypothetical protein